ncbi:MAG: globin domain-containing protein [Actinomycetota bacterium]
MAPRIRGSVGRLGTVKGEVTLYDAAGGMPFFEALVDRFYDGVLDDPVLLSLYPEPGDLGPARHKLALFLAQYWGGPTTYHEERGHPALRMRHALFAIGAEERDRWLMHMRAAVSAMEPPPDVAKALFDYFDLAADSLRNQSV